MIRGAVEPHLFLLSLAWTGLSAAVLFLPDLRGDWLYFTTWAWLQQTAVCLLVTLRQLAEVDNRTCALPALWRFLYGTLLPAAAVTAWVVAVSITYITSASEDAIWEMEGAEPCDHCHDRKFFSRLIMKNAVTHFAPALATTAILACSFPDVAEALRRPIAVHGQAGVATLIVARSVWLLLLYSLLHRPSDVYRIETGFALQTGVAAFATAGLCGFTIARQGAKLGALLLRAG